LQDRGGSGPGDPTSNMTSDQRPKPLDAGSALAALTVAVALTIACTTAAPKRSLVDEPGGEAQPPAPIAVTPQAEWRDAILYFVVLDRFADGDSANNIGVDRGAKGAFHGGDLEGLRQQLDELADLGVTALWITPLVKNIDGFVTGAGFPDWGYHGYWADDFTRLDPRFGSEEELAALVEDAHARGMKVLLDVVYNHVGYDSGYVTAPATRSWFRTENAGTCGSDDLTSCLAGLPDFKTDLPEVRDYLFAAHIGLAARVGLDGFRLDTVKHVTHDFWQEHRRRLDAELGEEFFLVGEVWGGDAKSLDPWFEGDEMDAGFDFSFQGSTIGFLLGRGRPVAFNRYLEKRHEVREGYHLAHFLSSHDVRGGLHMLEGDVDLFRLAALLQFTVGGIPTIYYGEEVARPGGDWPENRSDMPWGERDVSPGAGMPRDDELRQDYRRLIALRRAHPALWRGGHAGVHFDKDLLVFLRTDPNSPDSVMVAVNRGAEPVTASFELPAAWVGKSLRDVWAGEAVDAEGDRLEMEIAARSGCILTAD
jgi:alpha-amylase